MTLTTVSFGDITPQTPLGQFIDSLIMLLGYAIIAVPTGIVKYQKYPEVVNPKELKIQEAVLFEARME